MRFPKLSWTIMNSPKWLQMQAITVVSTKYYGKVFNINSGDSLELFLLFSDSQTRSAKCSEASVPFSNPWKITQIMENSYNSSFSVSDSQTQLDPGSEASPPQASPPSSSSPPHKSTTSTTSEKKGEEGEEVKVNNKPETVDRGVGSTPLPPTITEHRGPPYLPSFPLPFGFSDPRNGLDPLCKWCSKFK